MPPKNEMRHSTSSANTPFQEALEMSQLFDAGSLLDQLERIETAIWIFDFDYKRVVYANKSALAVWGAGSLEELRARHMGADMSKTVEERLDQYKSDFDKQDVAFSENWTLYPNGEPRVLHVTFKGFRLMDGRMAMMCEGAINRDLLPDNLRSAEALLHTPVMISLFTKAGVPLYRNPASRASCTDLDTNLFDRLTDLDEASRLAKVLRRQEEHRLVGRVSTVGGHRWHELTVRTCKDAVTGEPTYLVSEIDVTELHETKEHAQILARRDALTGLPNRAFVQDNLPDFLRQAQVVGDNAFLFLIDLDGFKTINDTMGHAAGDEMLRTVADAFRTHAGSGNIVARLGGDEFLMCINDTSGILSPGDFGEQLQNQFSEPRQIAGQPCKIDFSVGYCVFPEHGADIDALMQSADLALYEAKSERKKKCVRFTSNMKHKFDITRALDKDLERGLAEEEFVLFFQPRVCTQTGNILSAEALIRWQHPERGLVGPNEFIPAAERSGLITPLGEWVYRSAAREQRKMLDIGIELPLSINISPHQFSDPDILQKIIHLPAETGCNANMLAFEITESVLLGDCPHARETLAKFKEQGYQIIVDDFGTGYSNLAYLQDFPIDVLKIDRSFMENLDATGPIVRLILSLAKTLKIRSVAEGVETREQLAWLIENDCPEYQGFYFSRPIPCKELIELYRTNNPMCASPARSSPPATMTAR